MADCSIEYPGYLFPSGHILVLDWVLGTCFGKSLDTITCQWKYNVMIGGRTKPHKETVLNGKADKKSIYL